MHSSPVMAKPEPVPSEVPQKPRRRWPKRLGYSGGIFLVLLIAACAIAWQSRNQIANSLLSKAIPQFPGSIESVEWTRGGLELRNVVIRNPENGQKILELPSGHLGLNVLEARKGHLGVLTLDQPNITLGRDFWKTLAAIPTTDSGNSSFTLDGLNITNAKLALTSPDGQQLQTELDWTGGSFAMHEDGSLESGAHALTIRKLNAKPDSNIPGAEAEWIKAEFAFQRAERRLVIHQLTTSELSATAGATLWKSLGLHRPAEPSVADGSPPIEPSSADSPLREIQIDHAEMGPVNASFRHLPWMPNLPPGSGQVRLEITDLLSSVRDIPHKAKLTYSLTNFTLGEKDEVPWVSLPSFTAHAEIKPDGDWILHSAELLGTRVTLGPERFQALGLPENLPRIELTGTFQANFQNLTLHGSDLLGTDLQVFEWNDGSLKVAGADHAMLAWPAIKLSGSLDEIINQHRFRSFEWTKPLVQFTEADKAALFPESNAPVATAAAPEDPQLSEPAWFGWLVDNPVITECNISAKNLGPGIPDISGNLDMRQLKESIQLALSDIHVSTPDHPKAPALYRGQNLLVEANLEELWKRKRIERVSLEGSQVQVGATDADSQIPAGGIAAATTPSLVGDDLALPDKPETEPTDWHVGRVEFQNTKIYLHNLVPDVAEVLLPISHKTFYNVPLSMDGLTQSEKVERIELPLVYIPGTRTGTSVADLDTNFIHFSLAGLMRKEISLVECVNPKIYVGDSLFHYVDKIRSQSAAEPAPPAVEPITQARLIFGSLISLLTGAEMSPPAAGEESAWKIARVKAMNGKLITTVKDSPIRGVPPLPFGADSSLAEGEINAQLAVPPGLYKPVLGMELVVAISEGNIIFNLPAKDRDNNLVQVFKADWLRFKQFRIANVTLQVTYDRNGLYAKFWAKGYQGDLEGAFNLYFDDTLSWDMWLTGTGIQTQDITAVMTPAYFHMDGPVDFKLVAQGDKASLYQATGTFKNRTKGTIKIKALDDVLNSFPDDWSEAQKKWTRKSLETLRDFSYDKCDADLRFYGLEGEIHLKLHGPDGERNFDVFSHDRRLHVEEKTTP